jgi:hypothetical protein
VFFFPSLLRFQGTDGFDGKLQDHRDNVGHHISSSIKTINLRENCNDADHTWSSYFTRKASQKLNAFRRAVVPLRNISAFLILEARYEETWRRMPFRPTSYSTYFYGSVSKYFCFTFRTSSMYTYIQTVTCQRIDRKRLDTHPAIRARNNRTNVYSSLLGINQRSNGLARQLSCDLFPMWSALRDNRTVFCAWSVPRESGRIREWELSPLEVRISKGIAGWPKEELEDWVCDVTFTIVKVILRV